MADHKIYKLSSDEGKVYLAGQNIYPELFTEIQKLIITYGLPSLLGFIVIH
ncbi:hypothetical protein P9695_17050 [Weizmannia sp. CD-2023]|uniref:hypothetical protein n=1 Tax=Heyndrickxia TaxID=2837504 RepID=UPI002E1D613C|nr:hypothetical protein [Weizmannia sp. CD-2023]MED4899818.1 hypothetical protein [Weizmannia sp. CD-2023]